MAEAKNAKGPENVSASAREDGALGFPVADHLLAFAPDVRPAGALGEDAVSAAEAAESLRGADGGDTDSEAPTGRTRSSKAS